MKTSNNAKRRKKRWGMLQKMRKMPSISLNKRNFCSTLLTLQKDTLQSHPFISLVSLKDLVCLFFACCFIVLVSLEVRQDIFGDDFK